MRSKFSFIFYEITKFQRDEGFNYIVNYSKYIEESEGSWKKRKEVGYCCQLRLRSTAIFHRCIFVCRSSWSICGLKQNGNCGKTFALHP